MNNNHPAPRNILFALDFSECSQYALEWGLVNLVVRSQDTLTLLHIIEPPPAALIAGRRDFDKEEEETKIIEHMDQLWHLMDKKYHITTTASPKVIKQVEFGNPKTVIEAMSKQQHMTMILMGNHGRGASDNQHAVKDMGSVSLYCLKHCSVPVIVVKEPSLENLHQ